MFFDGPNLESYKDYHWECAKCGCKNSVDHSDCVYCETGIDPQIERDKKHDRNFRTMKAYFLGFTLVLSLVAVIVLFL